MVRLNRWRDVAALSAHAAARAEFAQGAALSQILLDLGRLYRDRLRDRALSVEAFEALLLREPGQAEALDWLHEAWREDGAWERICESALQAVEANWDREERLRLTRIAAETASDRLGRLDRAIAAWEQLWSLGDGQEEATRALAALYRRAGRWDELAAFLAREASAAEPATARLLRRELAEVRLFALDDAAGAAALLEEGVGDRGPDPVEAELLIRIHARLRRWDAVRSLADAPAVDDEALVERLHRIAAVLREAERPEEAAALNDRILGLSPGDERALSERRAWLASGEDWSGLVSFLEERASLLVGDPDAEMRRGLLLREAAALSLERLGDAERAVALYGQALELEPGDRETLRALAGACEAAGQHGRRREVLEELVRLSADRADRVEGLLAIARLCTNELNVPERAREALAEVLRLEPTHGGALEASAELNRRLGDQEAVLADILLRHDLTEDGELAAGLAAEAARHAEETLGDPSRARDAWLRALDATPEQRGALQGLRGALGAMGAGRRLAWVNAAERLLAGSEEARAEIDGRLVDLWREHGQPLLAVAAQARLAQGGESGLERLADALEAAGFRDDGLELLRAAICGAEGREARLRLLEALESRLREDEARARLDVCRWCLLLGDTSEDRVARLVELAREVGDVAGTTWVLQGLLAEAPESRRESLRGLLAELYERDLGRADLAWLLRLGASVSSAEAERGWEELSRLAGATGRHEDLLALLEERTVGGADEAGSVYAEIAAMCADEGRVGDPVRALGAWRRHLARHGSTPEVLAAVRELCKPGAQGERWAEVLEDLSVLAEDPAERAAHLASLEKALRTVHGDAPRAFAVLVRRFHLDPQGCWDALLREGTVLGNDGASLKRVLPFAEGLMATGSGGDRAAPLRSLAAAWATQGADPERGFELSLEALLADPDTEEGDASRRELARRSGRWDDLAMALRVASVRAATPGRRLALLQEAAEISAGPCDRPDLADDLRRRILQVDPDNLEAISALAERARAAGDWDALRRLLRRRARLVSSDAERVACMQEVAELCAERLDDPEGAFTALASVLETVPGHTAARASLASLVDALEAPELRLRWLQIELASAEGEEAARLQLSMAALQQDELDDPEGAVGTLLDLVAHSGPVGPAWERLSHLLPELGRWSNWAELLLQRAASEEGDAREHAVDEAVRTVRGHGEAFEARDRVALLQRALALRPADPSLRRDVASALMERSELETLAASLGEWAAQAAPAERQRLLMDQARMLALDLDQSAAAETVLRSLAEGRGGVTEPAVTLFLARLARQRGDWGGYVQWREAAMRHLEPRQAALHCCHLAEVCDEHEALRPRMVGFYREARGLDPDNACAREALRGIGRRLKALRPTAALLPEEGERDLSIEARADRLVALAEQARGAGDAAAEIDWLERALAVDPDRAAAWGRLATIREERGERDQGFVARLAEHDARARCDGFGRFGEGRPEVEPTLALAREAIARGEHALAVACGERAFLLAPRVGAVRLTLAQGLLATGREAELLALLGELHAEDDEDTPASLLADLFCLQGLALLKVERSADAARAFRAAVGLQPLHADALSALAPLEAQAGHIAEAVELHLRALAVDPDRDSRASRYFELGLLLEDRLGLVDEAGAAYEFALLDGLETRGLMHRVLRHCRRVGQHTRGLELVERLLPDASDADELAELWLARGEILAASGEPALEPEAVEAFDMALSYDPGQHAARLGLATVLRRRGDWEQLLELLHAIAEGGTSAQRADALLQMAEICRDELGRPDQATGYLRRSMEIAPGPEAARWLIESLGTGEQHREEREALTARLVGWGPPWYRPAAGLGEALLGSDPRRAWCLLAPAMIVREAEDNLRETLRGMRREYEKPPLRLLGPAGEAALEESGTYAALTAVMGSLERFAEALDLPHAGFDGAALSAISPHSGLGRGFQEIVEAWDLGNVTLHRAEELPEPLRIGWHDGAPSIAVRADLLPHLTRAEIGYVLGGALFRLRSGRRLGALVGRATRELLVRALWAALELRDAPDAESAAVAGRIVDAAGVDTLDAWAATLEPLAEEDPTSVARTWWAEVERQSAMAGLIAGADLLQVWKVVSVMDPAVERPMSFPTWDAVDEALRASPLLQQLIAFACSPLWHEVGADARER